MTVKEKIAEKLLQHKAKTTLDKMVTSQPGVGGRDDTDDSDGGTTPGTTSGGETDTDGSKWSKFKDKFKKKSTKRSSSKASTTDGKEEASSEDDEEAMDRLGLQQAKKDSNFGKTVYYDTDKKTTWNVLIRVIEGKDLPTGALRVRAVLDTRQKATRTCTEGVPRWRQNLSFSLKNKSLESLASEVLTLNVTSVGKIRERVQATFAVLMSAILHSPQRAIISKWVALRSPSDDDEETEDVHGANCGFLKISCAVYGNQDAPPHMNDDTHSDEVWSGAQLEDYTLRLRVFRLHHIAAQVAKQCFMTKKKKPIHFIVRVSMGKLKMETHPEEMTLFTVEEEKETNAVPFEEELLLPLQWPTLIQKINFELIMRQGRRRRVLGVASLPMRYLYEPGDDGFKPTFGPAFINFYGHEQLLRLKWRTEKQPIEEFSGSKYLARLLCSLDCCEYMGDSVMVRDIGHGPLLQSRIYEKTLRYVLYCSFQAANMINPIYASKPVSFHVSMGEYGSTGWLSHNYRASTFSAMPDTDKQKYFFMPWGNHRPAAEIVMTWEDVERRVCHYNAIYKVVAMLSDLMKEISSAGSQPPQKASILMEALDHTEELLDRLVNLPKCGKDKATTELDRQWQETRRKIVRKTLTELDNLRWEEEKTPEEAVAKVFRMLNRVKETITTVAEEIQISLPAVIIKMLAGEDVVGYAKINPVEIFNHDNDALMGEWCGRVRQIPLKWPTLVDRKSRREESPAVVHAILWLGRESAAQDYEELMRPAEKKHFLEVYVHQRKSKLNREWTAWKTPFTDEHRVIDMEQTVKRETFGYEHVGNWICRTSHDMWIGKDVNQPIFVERVYEVEKRGKDGWEAAGFTDYYGGDPEISMREAPKGWEYLDKWATDKHANNGDKSGWVYSMSEEFWGESGTVDSEERPGHRFRRRCIARTRRLVNHDKNNEQLARYEKTLGDGKWEYAANWKAAWHSSDVSDAAIRRRRFLLEVERKTDLPSDREHDNFFLPRVYEIHNVTTVWQLRCYLLWAKDLMPVVKMSSHAFVRVTFLTRAQQSIVVANSQNPIWCETLIFDKIPIPGGKRQIVVNPPTIMVEVRGERPDDSEIFLGRFEVQPQVICSPSDQRAHPSWHQLFYPNRKTRGAVLAAFELYHMDPTKDNLPLIPMVKEKMPDCFEVPGELKPKFESYAVQFLCWGVRNLQKYHLITVKKPFAELLIGDMEIYSDPVENTAKDPNFPNPLINIEEVKMPAALELACPMVINLHDTRALGQRPIVGFCHITDFTKYICHKKHKDHGSSRKNVDKFRDYVDAENLRQASIRTISTLMKEGEPPLDWWSKYYYSQGIVTKAPGFEESGIECLTVYRDELEKVGGYKYFTDFLDTFPLYKCAKGNFDDPEEKEKVGELKGKLFIMHIDGKDKRPELPDPPGVEFTGVTRCLLRVYVIEARGLVSQRRSGLCDPYLVVRCGKKNKNLKKSYRPDTVEPVFGELIEMEVAIPIENTVTVTLMDKRRLLADEEIGSTTIDLENRLLTKWRGTVGLPKQYTIHGELPWRDQVTPLTALRRYCKKMMLPAPEILERKAKDGQPDCGLKVLGVEVWYADVKQSWEKEDKRNRKLLERLKAAGDSEPAADGHEKEQAKDDGESKNKQKKSSKEQEATRNNKGEVKEDGDDEDDGMRRENGQKKWLAAAWGDGGEDCRKKSTLRKRQEKELTADERMAKRREMRNKIIGLPMECVALQVLNMMNLVPEHVETRTIHSPLSQNVSCGEVRMFIDLFPLNVGSIPAPLDISPRSPMKYQLRVAILKVSDAIPVKRSFGKPVCDLYVKVFINGQQKPEKTDIHYRSEDGMGEFNWRFVIPLDFSPWEQKIVAYRKTRLFRKAREELVEPLVIVQLWDKNAVKKDNLLGEMAFDITELSEGLFEPEQIQKYTRRRKQKKRCCCGCCSCTRKCCFVRCCCFLKDTRCCCKFSKKREPMPRAPRYNPDPKEADDPLNLFEASSVRGWWPMLSNNVRREDKAARKKKDDDYDPDTLYVMGLVEMDMQLVSMEEAEVNPVGKKRKEPNHSPHLSKPKRSKWNCLWITSRIKPACSFFWGRYGLQIVFWLLVIFLLGVLLFAIVTNWPTILNFIANA